MKGKGVTQPYVIRLKKAGEYKIVFERGYQKTSELDKYADMPVT